MTLSNLNFMKSEYYSVLSREQWGQRTQLTYQSDLNQFIRFVEGHLDVTDVNEITPEMIGKYRNFLFYYQDKTGKRYAVNTQAKKLTVVRGFFAWLCRSGKILFNPAKEIELPKKEKKLVRKPFTLEEISALFNAINRKSIVGKRDFVIFKLFYTTGIRVSELIGLELNDLDMTNGMLRVHGKGEKERFVPLLSSMLEVFQDYLKVIRPSFLHGNEEEALFLSHHGQPIRGRDGLQHNLKGYCRKAGITRKIGTHHFRVTCATRLMEGGADVRHIQDLLGHEKIETLEHYLKVSIKDLKDVHGKKHPREMMK